MEPAQLDGSYVLRQCPDCLDTGTIRGMRAYKITDYAYWLCPACGRQDPLNPVEPSDATV
jgi:predicted RNA-binding Zn-ribbon protein involved in translation (DUF1610 family)